MKDPLFVLFGKVRYQIINRRHTMKKTYNLIDLDCANCARKMEDAIKKLDGVTDATVSFLTQKMTVEADDDRFDAIMKQVVKCVRRVEPDTEIVFD